MNRLPIKLLILIYSVIWSNPSSAWTYLEHSFLTDRSCHEVLKIIEHDLSMNETNQTRSAKYMALRLLCPNTWQTEYCTDQKKNPTAYVNANIKEGQHGITLGDYTGLADHISQFGPVAGFPRLKKSGIISDSLLWLDPDENQLQGEIAKITRRTCSSDEVVDWTGVEKDLMKMNLSTSTTIQVAHWNPIREVN